MGVEEIVNPSYTVFDHQAVVLGEYTQSGHPSVVAKVNEGGWKSVFVGEPHLTGELLKGILRYAGVHLYDLQDDVVYAGADGVLVVHAPYTGQRTIQLPRSAAVYCLTERRLVARASSTFRQFMRGRTTHVFIWGEMEHLARVLNLSHDEELHTTPVPELQEEPREQEPEVARRRRVAVPVRPVVREADVPEASNSDLIEALAIPQEELNAAPTEAPEASGAVSPVRRRRWQRRRHSRPQGDKPATPPSGLVEDMLSDLQQRKRTTDEG
jgi:hypothetical protein